MKIISDYLNILTVDLFHKLIPKLNIQIQFCILCVGAMKSDRHNMLIYLSYVSICSKQNLKGFIHYQRKEPLKSVLI